MIQHRWSRKWSSSVRRTGLWFVLEAVVVWGWHMIQDVWKWIDEIPLWGDWLILISLLILVTILGWPDIRRWGLFRKVLRGASSQSKDVPTTVDYIEAGTIVDIYIEPALRDKRPGVRSSVRKDFMDQFDKVTGAKLGEYQYNRALLHQWMESNAARFLVDNRGKML